MSRWSTKTYRECWECFVYRTADMKPHAHAQSDLHTVRPAHYSITSRDNHIKRRWQSLCNVCMALN